MAKAKVKARSLAAIEEVREIVRRIDARGGTPTIRTLDIEIGPQPNGIRVLSVAIPPEGRVSPIDLPAMGYKVTLVQEVKAAPGWNRADEPNGSGG